MIVYETLLVASFVRLLTYSDLETSVCTNLPSAWSCLQVAVLGERFELKVISFYFYFIFIIIIVFLIITTLKVLRLLL